MLPITQSDIEDAGFVFVDSGRDAYVFDYEDVLVTSDGKPVYEPPLDCFIEIQEALIDVITTGRGSYECLGKRYYFCGSDVSRNAVCPKPWEGIRRSGYCSERGIIEFLKVDADSYDQPETVVNDAISPLNPSLFEILNTDAVRFPRFGDCRCDYYEEVCESRWPKSTTACKCDPDCEPAALACVEDDHCDSYCPPGTDDDCKKRDLFGRKPRSDKKVDRNFLAYLHGWDAVQIPHELKIEPPLKPPLFRPDPIIEKPIIRIEKPRIKKPRLKKPKYFTPPAWRMRRSCGWRGDCTTYLSPH